MSFEGYYQHLCPEGHLFCRDVYGAMPANCPHCMQWPVFSHLVDETNGYDERYPETYEMKFEILEEAVYETCNLSHKHLVKPARYKIPE